MFKKSSSEEPLPSSVFPPSAPSPTPGELHLYSLMRSVFLKTQTR